jgi:uncharacterized protein DUF1570
MPRRLRLLVALALALTCVAGCGGAGWTAGHPRSDLWLEVVTPHFVVQTDLIEPRARAVAHALEDSRAALLACAWPGATDPRGRTRALVFTRRKDFARYTDLNNVGVAFTRPGFERLLAFTPGAVVNVPEVAVHEIVHDLSRWFLPLQPLWLSEGLAVYLEGIRIDRARGRVVMGEVSAESVRWLNRTRSVLSLEKLFDTRESHSVDPRETAAFYASSWSLVHYLLNQRPQAFANFQRRLTRLTPWRRAWGESFPGLSNTALDEQLFAYLHTGDFTTLQVSFKLPPFSYTLRELSPAEAHGARALLADTSGAALAEAETEAALKLDPNELDALTVRFHSLPPSAIHERSELARRAVLAHPDEGEAWLLAALVATTPEERHAALTRAERRAPDHPGIASLLAEDALERKDALAALDHIRLVQRRSGVTPESLALHVAALAASRRCDDASAVIESATLMFDPECRVAAGQDPDAMTCSDYVRHAFERTLSGCVANAL